ncbi:MAG: hypothetical protein B0W54_22575 [Cellvibrio sp. 79]|nr:MAG: hypothetical protein B0W54_22575 [Cellvibrio sp. 79]
MLFVQIPGYKKTADLQAVSSSSKPLPVLVAVSIFPSRWLLYFYRCTYLLLAACLLLIIFPWLITNIAWAILLVAGWWGLWRGYRYQQKDLFAGELGFESGEWLLKAVGVTGKYQLAGEVLCWPLLIILPLRELDTRKCRYLLIANDSLSPVDGARLRTWLRVCLKPKT